MGDQPNYSGCAPDAPCRRGTILLVVHIPLRLEDALRARAAYGYLREMGNDRSAANFRASASQEESRQLAAPSERAEGIRTYQQLLLQPNQHRNMLQVSVEGHLGEIKNQHFSRLITGNEEPSIPSHNSRPR